MTQKKTNTDEKKTTEINPEPVSTNSKPKEAMRSLKQELEI